MISMHVPTFTPFVPHLTVLQNFVLSERPYLGLLPPPNASRRRARRTRRLGGSDATTGTRGPTGRTGVGKCPKLALGPRRPSKELLSARLATTVTARPD